MPKTRARSPAGIAPPLARRDDTVGSQEAERRTAPSLVTIGSATSLSGISAPDPLDTRGPGQCYSHGSIAPRPRDPEP